MIRFVLLFSVIASLAIGAPRDIAADFAVRDSKTAAKHAEDYFTKSGAAWVKEARPYRADSVVFSRAPVDRGATLKKGEPIWIVVVVNDAQSSDLQIPVGILWIRAKDGAVFETVPKEANQPLQPTRPSGPRG